MTRYVMWSHNRRGGSYQLELYLEQTYQIQTSITGDDRFDEDVVHFIET